jgi:hypothetical protein
VKSRVAARAALFANARASVVARASHDARRMRTSVRLLVALLAACGGGGNTTPPDATPDTAPPDMPPDVQPPNSVQVELFDTPPIFIMYREGTGAWRVPEETSTGYVMHIDKQWELVSVCGDATNGFDVGVEVATFAELGDFTFVPCFSTAFRRGTPVSLKGTMVQPGSVTTGIFNAKTSTTPNWSFDLSVDPGTLDLVASGNNRVVVRRDLDIQKATTLAKLDVVTDPTAVALGDLKLTVKGIAAGEAISTRTRLTTKNLTFANIARITSTTGKIAPDSLLQAGERQNITFSATSAEGFRSVFFRHTATSPTSFELLAPVTGVTFAELGASWPALPAGDVEVDIGAGANFLHVFATAGAIGTAKQLTLATDIPGFLPEWKPTTPDFRQLIVTDFGTGVGRSSGISEVLEGLASNADDLRDRYQRRYDRK